MEDILIFLLVYLVIGVLSLIFARKYGEYLPIQDRGEIFCIFFFGPILIAPLVIVALIDRYQSWFGRRTNRSLEDEFFSRRNSV